MSGLDKLANINPNAIGGAGGVGSQAPGAKAADNAAGAEFKQALDQAVASQGPAAADPAMANRLGAISAQMGTAATAAPIKGADATSSLKFSSHAIERMRSRGIAFSPETMKNIEGAVAKAAQKGSKDTLVLTDNSALIVSVKNNTVVTVMDKNAMKENVFTNIDSTVMV